MSRIENFTKYLDVVGFEQAPFAWHMSGLDIEDHDELIQALKGTTS